MNRVPILSKKNYVINAILKQSLYNYFNRRHTDSMRKQGTSCGQIFKNFKQHFRNTSCGKSSQKLAEKAFCQKCGKLLPRNKVARHISTVHNKMKNIQCTKHEYTTYSGFNLKLNFNALLLGKQLVKDLCPHCQNMTFSLLNHIKN